jgi:hypothetical protein
MLSFLSGLLNNVFCFNSIDLEFAGKFEKNFRSYISSLAKIGCRMFAADAFRISKIVSRGQPQPSGSESPNTHVGTWLAETGSSFRTGPAYRDFLLAFLMSMVNRS